MNIEWWYCTIPNAVILDKRLTPNQKLLYWIISSLCAKKWYCRSTNKYLWDILWVNKTSISNSISKLVECWYIIIEWENEQRVIALNMMVQWLDLSHLINEDNQDYEDRIWIGEMENADKESGEDKNKKVEDKKEKRKFDNKTKRLYWDYVSLTDEEYARLVYSFWRTEFVKDEKNHILKLTIHSKVVDDMIDNVNDRIDEKWNKAKYKDYYKALLKRFRNRKISTYYEYDNRDWEVELVEHFKTDPQGNLALRYMYDHCKKKWDMLNFHRLADKCWYSLTQNFDFLSESDEEKWLVEMYTDWWLVKDREW